ncbi:hypothetical protein G6F35_018011 [Rhizopus arrhizus]|nr:hypothetical protein G6F35_018011 [Rhizopus arrhizus]
MPANDFNGVIAASVLPPVAISMPKRLGSRSAILNGLPAPAHRMKMILRPGLSFSASNRRWAPAVKSVALAGRYSSCTILAFFSAPLKAFTPSRPKA